MGGLVDTVTLETAYSKPFPIDVASATAQDGSDSISNALLADIQPSFTFQGSVGQYTLAPWGPPVPGKGATLAMNLGIGFTAGAIGLMLLGRALIP